MEIILDKVRPTFMETISVANSEIWEKKVSFQKGSFNQIVAASGRGKTSIINFLYGLKNDHYGNISLNGKVLSDTSLEELSSLRRKKISIVFQDLKLFGELTCFENLMIKQSLTNEFTEEDILNFSEKLGVISKLKNKINICSYGERQRIAIIRSLLQPFEVLLLDEPFSHLDNKNIEKAMELIAGRCASQNATMIFADLEFNSFFKDHSTLLL